DTVDYGELSSRLVAAIAGDAVNVVGTRARRLADVVLAHPRGARPVVTEHGPRPPLRPRPGHVPVIMSRGRGHVRTAARPAARWWRWAATWATAWPRCRARSMRSLTPMRCDCWPCPRSTRRLQWAARNRATTSTR